MTLRVDANAYTLNIPRLDLSSTSKGYREGKGINLGNTNYLTQIRIQVSLTTFYLEEWSDSTNATKTDNTNNVEVAVYCR